MISRQLRLHFDNQPGRQSPGPGRHRRGRAHWWFEKMRGIVENAPDWPSAAPPSEPAPPATTTSPSPSRADVSPSPPAYRWKFSRARQVRWE